MDEETSKAKVWVITGVSSGLGYELAAQVQAAGDIVVGTVRTPQQQQIFQQRFPLPCRVLLLDLALPATIPAVVDQILALYGRIDVLVNNAGYGLIGAVEEASDQEARHQMEVSFFGPLSLTQAVLPAMRAKAAGHIIQISSRLGLVAAPGFGLYAAGKFALEGVSEALANEIAPFGIHLTLVELGPVRTEFFGRSLTYAQHEIDAYRATTNDVRTTSKQRHGQQAGDPVKIAQSILTCARLVAPPLRLPLTPATIEALRQKIAEYQSCLVAWEPQALATSYET